MTRQLRAHGMPRPDKQAIADAGLRAFFKIVELWGLTDSEAMTLLGSPSRGTFYNWKRGNKASPSRDVMERLSYVVGIYKALQILFSDPQIADAWVSRPNEAFGGRSALDRMKAGNVSDLHAVRGYLDYVRGGGS